MAWRCAQWETAQRRRRSEDDVVVTAWRSDARTLNCSAETAWQRWRPSGRWHGGGRCSTDGVAQTTWSWRCGGDGVAEAAWRSDADSRVRRAGRCWGAAADATASSADHSVAACRPGPDTQDMCCKLRKCTLGCCNPHEVVVYRVKVSYDAAFWKPRKKLAEEALHTQSTHIESCT